MLCVIVAVCAGALQDVMARYARMAGKKTLWLPGTDHAGIATQVSCCCCMGGRYLQLLMSSDMLSGLLGLVRGACGCLPADMQYASCSCETNCTLLLPCVALCWAVLSHAPCCMLLCVVRVLCCYAMSSCDMLCCAALCCPAMPCHAVLQNVVEKQLEADGSSRAALGRQAFEERVWSWKEE